MALGSGSLHPVVGVAPPNLVGDLSFTLGEGTTTFDDGDLVSHTITCEDGDTCKLVILLQVPGATDYADFPVTFGTPKTPPSQPTAVHATAGNQQADVSWTAPSDDGGAAITGYTVTSSPGGQTCTTATLDLHGDRPDQLHVVHLHGDRDERGVADELAEQPVELGEAVAHRHRPSPTPHRVTPRSRVTWSAANPVPNSYTVTSSPGAKTCTTS